MFLPTWSSSSGRIRQAERLLPLQPSLCSPLPCFCSHQPCCSSHQPCCCSPLPCFGSLAWIPRWWGWNVTPECLWSCYWSSAFLPPHLHQNCGFIFNITVKLSWINVYLLVSTPIYRWLKLNSLIIFATIYTHKQEYFDWSIACIEVNVLWHVVGWI